MCECRLAQMCERAEVSGYGCDCGNMCLYLSEWVCFFQYMDVCICRDMSVCMNVGACSI